MPITKTIQTTTAQILDPNGNVGNGQIIVTPSQGFEYYDGVSTITVSNASTTVAVQSGLLASTFTLQPNTGATNNPDKTFYIVNIAVNGITQPPIFWQIDSADASTLEFSDVTKLPSGEVSELDDFRNEANPLKQYILRSDAVDVATVGTASDGIGYVVRAGSDGKIDPDFIDSVGAAAAVDVTITDAGGYYTGTEVEAALQEAGAADANTLKNETGGDFLNDYTAGPTSLTSTFSSVGTGITLTQTGKYFVSVSLVSTLTTGSGTPTFRLTIIGPTFAVTPVISEQTITGAALSDKWIITKNFYVDVTSISTPTLQARLASGATGYPCDVTELLVTAVRLT